MYIINRCTVFDDKYVNGMPSEPLEYHIIIIEEEKELAIGILKSRFGTRHKRLMSNALIHEDYTVTEFDSLEDAIEEISKMYKIPGLELLTNQYVYIISNT